MVLILSTLAVRGEPVDPQSSLEPLVLSTSDFRNLVKADKARLLVALKKEVMISTSRIVRARPAPGLALADDYAECIMTDVQAPLAAYEALSAQVGRKLAGRVASGIGNHL